MEGYQSGIKVLVLKEETIFFSWNDIASQFLRWLQVIFASGTGTTAYFAALHLRRLQLEESIPPDTVEVIALPCATTADELESQMKSLARQCQYEDDIPKLLRILKACDDNGSSFAEPSSRHFRIWQSLTSSTNIYFDLIYAPRAIEILLEHAGNSPAMLDDDSVLSHGLADLFPDANIIYYHCGGTEGNESQIARYKYKGLLKK